MSQGRLQHLPKEKFSNPTKKEEKPPRSHKGITLKSSLGCIQNTPTKEGEAKLSPHLSSLFFYKYVTIQI